MPGERQWVEQLRPRLETKLAGLSEGASKIRVETGRHLPYVLEVLAYGPGERVQTTKTEYQTDLLISDATDEAWTPRVVVECKLGRVSTHDALTYSTKASTHKNPHPYLRYGILIGGLKGPLPLRLIRHGAHFDFMIAFDSEQPTRREWSDFVEVLEQEVRASRDMQRLLTPGKNVYRLLHRPLKLG